MKRSAVIESSILIGLGLAYIAVINAGTANGIGYFHQPQHDLLLPLVHGAVYNGATFWLHGFVLIPRLAARRRIGAYVLAVLGLSLAVLVGKTLGEMAIIAFDFPDLADLGFVPLALENLWMLLAFLGLSAIYGTTRYALLRGARVRRLELEKAETELALLRSQIHPHFLFNVLNDLYSLGLQKKVEEMTDGVARLSRLLRFVLYDCQSERVPLERELDFLRQLVELHRMMLANGASVTFEVAGRSSDLEIAPMLLSPLIENAFKHGISGERDSFVETRVEVGNGSLVFRQLNSVHPEPPRGTNESVGHPVDGVGLANLRQRLELLYPGRHRLELERHSDRYSTTLELELAP